MAQKARVSVLTSQLLAKFESVNLNDQLEYGNSRRERIYQILLDPKPTTVNQFEIANRFGGLEEKFRVFNNDELADALHGRLDELYTRSNQWTPEILSLILELSDDPVHQTEIEGLDQFKPLPQPSPLTWSDIVRDDPLDNHDGLWNDVDFAQDGSDEDADVVLPVSSESDVSSTTSGHSDCITEAIQELSIEPDWDGLQTIKDQQFWDNAVQGAHDVDGADGIGGVSAIDVTEAQGIREIGFMLCGLPTSIYEQRPDGESVVSPRYQFKYISQPVSSQVLQEFSAIAFDLARIWMWKSVKHDQPVLQTFRATLAEKLAETERGLILVQTSCLQSEGGNTASLLCFLENVKEETRLIRQFTPILDDLRMSGKPQASFYVLELLYNRVCMSHGIGDMASFNYMVEVFLACFRTYLKPLKHWMEHGELMRHDQKIFIQEHDSNAPLDLFWADRYQLSLDPSGRVYAPAFLHLAARKILNTGKSVHFLRLLGYSELQDHGSEDTVFQLDMDSFVAKSGAVALNPFSESFERALSEWIGSSYHSSSVLLQQILDTHCGLCRTLDALEHIYLFRNGAISNIVADTVFARIDRGRKDWNDPFALTDIFRSGFATITCIDADNLSVLKTGSASDPDTLKTLLVNYSFPWPVANIIKRGTLKTYQRIFSLLLQLQRSKRALEHHSPRKLVAMLMTENQSLSAVMLRHRMLWFVNTVLSYLTGVVLAAATANMRGRMSISEDLDEMVASHQDYIARLDEQCLLCGSRKPVLQAITSILDLILLFTETCAPTLYPVDRRDPFPAVATNNGQSRRCPPKAKLDISDSEDDGADEGFQHDPINPTGSWKRPSSARLKNMHDTFMRLQGFVHVSLRSSNKGGEGSSVEMLSDMLSTDHVMGRS